MLPNTLLKGFDRGRLRILLALFFLALAIPTAILVWQGYSQLKWEAFHQHRGVAEELTGRIDDRLREIIKLADARSFADYTFLVVSGDPSAGFVQRSPLSAYPVAKDLPGVLGYFQVDTDGVFSTPILPPVGAAVAKLGIADGEYADRVQLAQQIQAVLADNRLVQSRQDIGVRRRVAATFVESEAAAEELDEVIAYDVAAVAGSVAASSSDGNAAAPSDGGLSEKSERLDEVYSQQIFDQLNASRPGAQSPAEDKRIAGLDGAEGEAYRVEQRPNPVGKVSDLKLDAALQKKSEELEREYSSAQVSTGGLTSTASRSKRKEQIALPESSRLDDSQILANVAGPTELRINTFESEIDPFEFSVLDSGHFVLFRNVWRDGERYIQGLLVDQKTFIEDIIVAHFKATALAEMSNLIVAYHDDVIHTSSGVGGSSYPNVAEGLGGALLYRSRLTSPLDGMELVFGIERLPPGPGASILAWVTLVLAIVFVGGFVALYRMGLSQINLARQQQDFVSAVSHELKTPLTSIRMYGEMLKEGWADEDKRQSYYEFIHDESERLSRLISNVLQLARITRNEPQFDLRARNVGELLSNIESKIASQVERAGFDLQIKRTDDADQATITVDEDCFAQIIINLVDNAIKFSKEADQKTIEISSKRGIDGRIVFAVRDFGPGIPKDQMKKIFQLFYRSESELTRETVGTGIGLAIVHQLTLGMNGSVDMNNADPGAEFRIMFSIDS